MDDFDESTYGILDSAPDATIIVDDEGVILFASQQVTNVFGYQPNELLQTAVEQLIPKRYRTQHSGLRASYSRTRKFRAMGEGRELFGIKKNGDEFPVEISLSPLAQGDQERLTIAAIRDVTARKEVEDALSQAKDIAEKATRTKSRFLAAASHDLRQPLQTVAIYTDVMKRILEGDPAKALDVAEKIETSLGVMRELLDALLDVAKLDTGVITPEFSHFSLQSMFDALQTDNQPTANEKGLWLEVESTDQFAFTDPALLQRILENFITNAIRYTETGGVTVRALLESSVIRIEVEDSGIGIPESSIESIFDEYFQLDNQARDRQKGLGLGLSIVKNISDLMATPVTVSSTINEGSIFAVTVPIGVRTEVVEAAATTTSEKRTPVEAPLVLVAEDDPTILDATCMMLELAGLRTTAANDGIKAISMLADGLKPDMVVSDYRLPGKTGVDVIKSAKEYLGSDFPAVMITGDTSGKKVQDAGLTNCTVLTKPVDTKQLVRLIEEATAQS